jgi:hypothetical protein
MDHSRLFEYVRKSAVAGSLSSDFAGLSGLPVDSAWTVYVTEIPGIRDRLAPLGLQLDLVAQALVTGEAVTAELLGEGIAFPVARMALSPCSLTPKKVGALWVVSKESIQTTPGAEACLRIGRAGIRKGVDRRFLTDARSECSGAIEASENRDSDIEFGLNLVCTSGAGRHFFVGPPALANKLTVLPSVGGGQAYPDMSPEGGTFYGLPFLVSDVLTSELFLIDASGLITGASDILLRTSESANVEMDTAPSMDAGTPSAPTGAVVSIFQVDAIAFIATRSLVTKLSRPNAVAVWDGIDVAWSLGNPAESS